MFFSFFSLLHLTIFFFFFFNDTATTEIYTLSLHDALPISPISHFTREEVMTIGQMMLDEFDEEMKNTRRVLERCPDERSEEHTSELQSRSDLVCRLLLEKKKKKNTIRQTCMRCIMNTTANE